MPVAAVAAVLAIGLSACSAQDEPSPEVTTGDRAAPTDLRTVDAPMAAGPGADTDPGPGSDSAETPAAAGADSTDGVQTIEWDTLIPPDFRPDKLVAQLQLDDISDDDPRAQAAMDKIKALWDQAPVREELDGQAVRLPGFVVPVEASADETTGFLLVPYYGACIHVPPPPANQTVYVLTEAGEGADIGLFEVVWVTGTISVKRIDNEIAEAGYTIYASDIAPYE